MPANHLLRRVTDWRVSFNTAINDIRRLPFEWGTNDCGPGFAGRICEALTGFNPAADHIGKYSNAEEAYAYLQGLGFNDLAEATESILYPCPVSRAQIGDVVAFEVNTPFKYALGVVNGETAFVRTHRALASVHMLKADRAFKIG